jgi:hypothetical protein
MKSNEADRKLLAALPVSSERKHSSVYADSTGNLKPTLRDVYMTLAGLLSKESPTTDTVRAPT